MRWKEYLEKDLVEVARRDTKTKESIGLSDVVTHVAGLMDIIQDNLLAKAKKYRADHTSSVDDFDQFKEVLENKGGFILAHWDGTAETEDKIKELTKASIRCIPNNAPEESGKCVYSGKPSSRRVLFAKAY